MSLVVYVFCANSGGHSPGVLGQLPLLCYWVKKKKEDRVDAEANTDELKELIRDITG